MEIIRTELANMQASITAIIASPDFDAVAEDQRLIQAILTINDNLETIEERVGQFTYNIKTALSNTQQRGQHDKL